MNGVKQSDVRDRRKVHAFCGTVIDLRNVTNIISESNVGVGKGNFKTKYIVTDSGATRHMFHNRDHFTNYRETSDHHVRVANGVLIPVLGIGEVGPLKDVLHVPLFSPSRA